VTASAIRDYKGGIIAGFLYLVKHILLLYYNNCIYLLPICIILILLYNYIYTL
jgi:hypothetical protein